MTNEITISKGKTYECIYVVGNQKEVQRYDNIESAYTRERVNHILLRTLDGKEHFISLTNLLHCKQIS